MSLLRIQDPRYLETPHSSWHWAAHNVSLFHIGVNDHPSTTLHGGPDWDIIYQIDGLKKPEEIWSEISPILMLYGVLCEPIHTEDRLDLPMLEM